MLTLLNRIDGTRKALYQCECGKNVVAWITNVNSKHTQSCGCFRRFVTGQRARKHGRRGTRTRAYVAWLGIKSRCRNKKTRDYSNYGGRGIDFDERWNAFENFLTDMGEPPIGMSIDRIDNNANYSKENCRWASRIQQNLNKRNVKRYEYNGKSLTLGEWAKETGIQRLTLYHRIKDGASIEEALTRQLFAKRKSA